MEYDFTLSPPVYIRLITEDNKTLYYPRDRLIESCGFLSTLAENYAKEEFIEISLALSSYSLNLFLTFLKKKDLVYSLEEDIEILRIADMMDVHYLSKKLSNKRDILNHFDKIIQSEYHSSPYTFIVQFLRVNRFLPLDWGSYHYLLTHRDDLKEFYEKRTSDLPYNWPSNGEKVEYEGRIYYVYRRCRGDYELYEEKQDKVKNDVCKIVGKWEIAPPL